ncbi:MAG TPA: ComEC/Rec2 family competence protein [Clostridia bacterium]|nr:ComEC/Rec2 family competence protein [Clostridia bacterium]
MSQKRRSGKGKYRATAVVAVIVFLCVLFAVYHAASAGTPASDFYPTPSSLSAASAQPVSAPPGVMDVYMLDVGQGDSIFLLSPSGKTMLVDAGEASEFDKIDAFLKSQGVTKLDVVVATHPHSDHIGAMSKVINAYEIGTFYMPDIAHTTATFEKMVDALEEQNVSVKRAEANGETYMPWSDEVTVRILSPMKDGDYDQESLNDWSVVLHVSFGNSSILLTGDAEEAAEEQMLSSYGASVFRATVLKAGHHGSRTSGSEAFLDAVNPRIALISCGLDNSYGHPHKETLERYAARGIEAYRTDQDGTIHLTFAAEGVKVETEK